MNPPSCPAPAQSAEGTSAFIALAGVTKTYPGTAQRALDGVTLAIPRGEIFGLLGPNGAGKTTLLSMLVGRIKPDAGRVTIGGRDITHASLVRTGISPQEPAIYPSLTARENLEYFGRMQGLRGAYLKQRVQVCLDLAEMGELAERRAEQLSGGYKRRLNLVIALIHEPELLILDETTVAIDPHSRALIHQRLRELHAQGVTIVLSTHYMEEAEQLCQQVAILNHGRVVTQGAVATLLASQHSDLVSLRLDRDPPDTLRPLLLGLPGIRAVTIAGRCIRLSAAQPEHMVGPLLDALHAAGVAAQALSFGTGSLEQVFLSLTQAAREEAA
jgi:ABC-2 type transport system ATP-binding protein